MAGDEVETSEISIHDIQNATGVAVGPGATSIVNVYHRISPEDRYNQRSHILLRQTVSRFWIEDYLNHALYDEVLLHLEMQLPTDEVDSRPWHLVLPQAGPPEQRLSVGTGIVGIFDEMSQRLLILGEPGSGKTITLLELARDLLARAEADPTHVSPVVLNLSSWTERRQSLVLWLVEELYIRYRIPKKVAQEWVEKDELLLLLDGLDEVTSAYREECVDAINQYLQEHHLVSLAVCSRTAEYEALSVMLKLHGAVVLQPLMPDQIEVYLDKAGTKLSALRALLHQDENLFAMASSPLFLNIMSLAYQGLPTVDFTLLTSTQARHQHLFNTYIQRMLFMHREVQHVYEAHNTLRWLHWLAARLVEHGQADFLIERMQPSWLQAPNRRALPVMPLMILWGSLYGLGAGGIMGFAFGLFSMVLKRLTTIASVGMPTGPVSGLVLGLAGGLCFGLVAATVDGLNGGVKEIRPADQTFRAWATLRSRIQPGLYWGLLYGLAFHLFHRYGRAPINALMFGLVGALVAGLVAGFIRVKPRWPFRWTNENLLKNVLSNISTGVGFGLLVGTSFGLLIAITADVLIGLDYGLTAMLTAILPAALDILLLAWPVGAVGGLLFRLLFEPEARAEIPDSEETQTPNQGIKLSAHNALTLGLSFGLLGLAIGLWLGFLNNELYLALVFGLFFGLTGGLMGGAEAVVKHCILRVVLYLDGVVPRNYAHFLDHCVDLILLRKIGGGYRFTHGLLMEHFAAMTDDDIERLTDRAVRKSFDLSLRFWHQ